MILKAADTKKCNGETNVKIDKECRKMDKLTTGEGDTQLTQAKKK